MRLPLILALLLATSAHAQYLYMQPRGHSHNDYEQKHPFTEAYSLGFASIEADIFLIGKDLIVAHSEKETAKKIRLVDEYLVPVLNHLRENHNHPYADPGKRLQMLIDIKTIAWPTLKRLQEVLDSLPELTRSRQLTWVISGNRTPADSFVVSDQFIRFDGVLSRDYDAHALSRIDMLSDNLATFTAWKGAGPIPEEDRLKLEEMVKKAHAEGKPVRFWNAPDNKDAWKELLSLGVDYINTDHLPELAKFLAERK